jgi:hypothetical protein
MWREVSAENFITLAGTKYGDIGGFQNGYGHRKKSEWRKGEVSQGVGTRDDAVIAICR